MKTMTKKQFSFSEEETEYFKEKQSKIEVVSCPRKDKICQEHLLIVNKCYVESEHYFREKNFNSCIDTIKDAFYETAELTDPPCSKCAVFFRSTITASLENMRGEIEKMSSGFFGNKSYQPSCIKAADALNEFKKFELHNSFKTNESNGRFIGNFAEKKVS